MPISLPRLALPQIPINMSLFPIYTNDGLSICRLNATQKHTIQTVSKKIALGEYRLVDNHCLCGNTNARLDIVISEKDRYGFNISSILCGKCGLVRSGKVFDEDSNIEFYKKDYRSIYVGAETPPDVFFEDQLKRGRRLLRKALKILHLKYFSHVFEIGCGSGGILYPFAEKAERCSGCDYNEKYLAYGRKKGLDLKFGKYSDLVRDDSIQLLILSHVMEHFLRPVEEIQRIITIVAPGGYLLVEVPGIFNIHLTYYSPLSYLQNAHSYNFFRAYLNVFFEQLGLKVVYGDERCLFVLQKPDTWQINEIPYVFDATLAPYPRHIKRYLVAADLMHKLKVNPFEWMNVFNRMITRIGASARGRQTEI